MMKKGEEMIRIILLLLLHALFCVAIFNVVLENVGSELFHFVMFVVLVFWTVMRVNELCDERVVR